MPTIEERTKKNGKQVFAVKVRLKGQGVQCATFERKTDAKRWAASIESAIREGRHFKTAEAKRHTLGEMVDRYIKEYLPKKSSTMQRDQKTQLRWWKEELGAFLLSDITPALIAGCRDKLLAEIGLRNKKRSPASTSLYMAALSHTYTVAIREWGWVDDTPFRKVQKPKLPRGRVRFLSDDERDRLLLACKESPMSFLYPIVVLALSTGARKSEILNLKWEDLDFKRKVAILHHTKNGDRRALPLTGHALEEITELSKIRRLQTNLLFPNKTGKGPIEIRPYWIKALKEARIEDFRFHDLRHSAASYLAMNGASLTEIAGVLGHKTLQMVKRYSHLSEQHTVEIVSKMNQAIFGV